MCIDASFSHSSFFITPPAPPPALPPAVVHSRTDCARSCREHVTSPHTERRVVQLACTPCSAGGWGLWACRQPRLEREARAQARMSIMSALSGQRESASHHSFTHTEPAQLTGGELSSAERGKCGSSELQGEIDTPPAPSAPPPGKGGGERLAGGSKGHTKEHACDCTTSEQCRNISHSAGGAEGGEGGETEAL